MKASHLIHLAALDLVELLLSSHQYAFLDLLAGSHCFGLVALLALEQHDPDIVLPRFLSLLTFDGYQPPRLRYQL